MNGATDPGAREQNAVAAALAAYDAGLNPYPPKEDGSKRPDARTWTVFRDKRLKYEQVPMAFAGRSGVGIFTGRVFTPTGHADVGIECLEFDDPTAYAAFMSKAEDAPDVRAIVEAVRTGYEEQTPSGGIHLFYYCTAVEGNQKLAQRPKRGDEKQHENDTVKTLIETRGRGGYVIVAPSHGRVHPSGKPYVLRGGGFGSIVTITPEQRQTLFALAREFDQMPRQKRTRSQRATGSTSAGAGNRPGDDFNRRATWNDVLGPLGWEQNGGTGATAYWRRPGASQGSKDATTNADGTDRLYVHSTSAAPFETDRYYTKFQAFALLYHDGDFKAAAETLRKQGYGRSDDGTRAQISAADGNLNRVGDQTVAALSAANNPARLFVSTAGEPARISRDGDGRAFVQPLGAHELRYETGKVAKFVRPGKTTKSDPKPEPVEVPPPLDVVRNVRARESLPLPPLVQVVATPIFGSRVVTSLKLDSGYVPDARAYVDLAPGFEIRRLVSPNPGAAEIEEARSQLDELFRDFPFVGDADRANAFAFALLPFGRAVIGGSTPLHVIEAATPGSGKSLLLHVATSLATGAGGAPTLAEAEDDAEWRKKITSKALAGDPYFAIGNLKRPLDSPSLAEALTTPQWEDRLLGTNRTVRAPIRFIAAVTDQQTGKRKSLYGKTRREVAERLKVALRDQQQGLPVVSEKLTVAQYLTRWLEASAKPSVKTKTYEGYESIVRVRVVPRIGRTTLSKVTPLDLQVLYADLQRDGLSSRSAHHTHRVLHRAFGQAVRWNLIPRNPCDGVTPPKPKRSEMRVLSQAQVGAFLDATRDHPAHALYVLAVTTGMRQGELLGLRWEDVDLDATRLVVRRALQRQNEAGLVFVEPKTSRSRRTIVLSQRAVAALRRHRTRQLEQRLLVGSDWQDQDLVFCNQVGGPLDPSWQRQTFYDALRLADLPTIRFHDLRHTAATLLLVRGVHFKVVSEMLGHATVTLTLDTYSHLVPVLHAQAAAAMDELLGA